MRRREFTSLPGGAVATWPTFASAQRVTSPGLQAAPAPEEALSETRYRTIDVGEVAIQEIYPHCANPSSLCGAANITEKQA
jgi:hypothetical protein